METRDALFTVCHNPAKLPFDNAYHRDPARFRPTPRPRTRRPGGSSSRVPINENTIMSNPDNFSAEPNEPAASVSRRGFLKLAGVSSLATATGGLAAARAAASNPDGTPEQVHLTWGSDPTSEVAISWVSLAPAVNPRARIVADGEAAHTVHGVQRLYTDGLNGETVFTYHARVHGLKPNTRYRYELTADNDSNVAQPFSATFTTAPRGRAPFRFTSYGDLATPNGAWVLSSPQSRFAVQAVEQFQPLFHLLNGDLCYANLNPAHQPEVWRDFGNNNQTSAANRPWMPCPGNHEIEFNNGPQGLDSYLARYTLPENGTRFPGRSIATSDHAACSAGRCLRCTCAPLNRNIGRRGSRADGRGVWRAALCPPGTRVPTRV